MFLISSVRLAQKLFRRRGDGNVVALDLDLRHAVHLHRHALARVNFRRLHIDGQQFQREDVHLFDDRPDERAAALDDAKADASCRPPAHDVCVPETTSTWFGPTLV